MATTHSPKPQQHLTHLQAHPSGELPFSRPHTPYRDLVVGFCGLGAMGFFMARNLANRQAANPTVQHPILVWNRTRAKSEELVKELGEGKIKIVDQPQELAVECDVVLTNLANDEVVKQIYVLFAEALKVRFVHI